MTVLTLHGGSSVRYEWGLVHHASRRRLAEAPASEYQPGPARPPLPTEAELSWLWQGQRQPPESLTTPDGRSVTVIYPGRRAGGAGPDYRDAVVVVQGRRQLGDVELHVRASSFVTHGHHLDAAYNRLALHVVFADDSGGSVQVASGRHVPTAALKPWVDQRRDTVASWLAAPALWTEPCLTASARRGEEGVDQVLAGAGGQRLLRRSDELAAIAMRDGQEQALWQALLDALALGGDRDGFARLARALPAAGLRRLTAAVPRAESHRLAASIILGVAGLAPLPRIEGLPGALERPPSGAGLRPANRPERRLQAAAALFWRARPDLPEYALHSVAAAASARELTAAWSVSGEPGGVSLSGAARTSEVLLHAVLPFAAIRPALRPRALELAGMLPALPVYGKTAFLETNLQRPNGRRRPRSVLAQQGLIELHARWCSQGGCGICPLS